MNARGLGAQAIGFLVGLLRGGQPYSRARLLAELSVVKHTDTSQALFTALSNRNIRLVLDDTLTDLGVVKSAKTIRIHPRLRNMQTTLGILVHEGRHVLDIRDGLVPRPRRATPAQRLLAEGRAWASELEFLQRNEFTASRRWRFLDRPPRELLIDIETAYDIQGVSTAEFAEILESHLAAFPYW
jgi:hypothetical protein